LGLDPQGKGNMHEAAVATLHNVLFYARRNYLKNHFKSKRKLIWASSSGETVMLRGCVDMSLIDSALNHIPEEVYPVGQSVKQLVTQLSNIWMTYM
jgi:hypothetical protein